MKKQYHTSADEMRIANCEGNTDGLIFGRGTAFLASFLTNLTKIRFLGHVTSASANLPLSTLALQSQCT